MFFVLSKILWIVTAPTNLLIGLLVLGNGFAGRGWSGTGRRALRAGAIGLMLCGFLPLGTILLSVLENRFPPAPQLAQDPTGIIVLGGAIDQVVSAARGVISMPESATRLTEAVILARRFPKARLVYTGGSNALTTQIGREAGEAQRLWIALGVAPDRITLEDRSRNTYENAEFSRSLLDPKPDQRWILVTSAYHMPRSMGLFRAAGFAVIPDPVDYRTSGTWRDFVPNREAGFGLERFDFASREWIGLVAYRLSGKIADIFPAP